MKPRSSSLIRALSCAIAAGLVLAALTGCGSAAGSTTQTKVAEGDSGKSVTLKKGDTLEVTLEGNPSTGFSWVVTQSAGGAIAQRGEARTLDSASGKGAPAIVGASESQFFTFDAVKSGSGRLVMEYKRSWETTVPAQKTYTLDVVVD